MKIIVLGSSGFIGSNALKYFRKRFPETMGCDVMENNSDKQFIKVDILNPDFDAVFRERQFDICINASGSGNVPYSITHPDEDHRLNTNNVFLILNAISKYNPTCRFINFSSAAVYGNPVSLPIKESTKINPVSPYGFHKLMSEEICSEFFNLKNIPTCSVRVFSAYGMGLRKQLFWDIYRKSLNPGKLTLFGTGKETRDFIHINDIISAIECVIEKNSFEADVVNVATGKSFSIKEAAETAIKAMGSGKEISFTNKTKEGDPDFWQADVSKLNSFGFSPKVTLEEGLKGYYSWVQSL